MAANDLCQLADVKAWLGRTDSNSDTLLSALITRASRQILSYLQRGTILPRTITELRDGTGTQSLTLKSWPAIAVSALIIDNQTIPQSPAMTGTTVPVSGTAPIFGGAREPGWMLETWDGTPPGRPQTLSLSGFSFGLSFPGARNFQDVQIVYAAGYQVTNEPQTVESGQVTVNAPFGAWASDCGVSYVGGAALNKVASAPSVGQYALDPNAGTYDFNAGDDGQSVLVSYGFVPSDLADACIELVSERYKYSQRIGEKTHSLGGNETVAFDNSRLTPLVQSMLQPYRQILPV
jgi:hypothetical protein